MLTARQLSGADHDITGFIAIGKKESDQVLLRWNTL